MSLSDAQQAALATLTLAYPGGISITDDRTDEIAVCDSLVESGHAVLIESDDFDGSGYQLSEEMAEAHRQVIEEQAEEAAQN